MAGIRAWLKTLLGETPAEASPTTEVACATAGPAIVAAQEPPELRPVPGVGSPGFMVAWGTDVGQVRDHNEDGLFVFAGEQRSENAIAPFGLWIVADGMGGHQSGELASALAMRTTASELLSQVYLPLVTGTDRTAEQPSLAEVLVSAISRANQVVTRDLPGSGCTLTCAMALGDWLYVGHVGDSRAYLLRPDTAPIRLTKDHSFVGRLIEMGQLTEGEAATHPKRNVLYRAVGQPGELEVDTATQPLRNGDRLLLCSDGLWAFVKEADMWQMIEHASTLQEACSDLINAANAAGGSDNITALLVEVEPTPA